jgi:DNA-binding transcriptional ArsR family regulator
MSDALRLKTPEKLSPQQLLKLPTRERELHVRHVILETVRNNEDGVTVQMLCERLPFTQATISKHLTILKHTNEVYTRTLGNTVLYLPNSRLMHPAMESSFPLTDKDMRISLLKNRLGEFVLIQEKRKNGYADETGGGVLIPKAAFREFVRFLRDFSNGMEHA